MIKEMIYGPLEINGDGHYQPATEYQATYPDKYYLYEIVSNKTNQIDVDKWDYFARDSYHLGVTSNFIHDRFMKFAKVFSVRKNKRWETQICYRDKEAPSAYEMFHTRYRLYRMACYHPVTVAMDLMITDVLLEAAPHFELKTSVGKSFFMKDMLTDMEAYRVLDDNILNLVRHSYGNEKLVPAREILQRMQKREIYKLVARFQLQKNQFIEDKDVDLDEIVDREENIEKELKNGHLCFKVVTMDYGLKDENPVDRVLFYSKGDRTPRRIAKDRVSFLLPHTFEERQLYFYVKDYSKKDVAAKVINARAREKQWILESQNIGLLSTVTDLKKPTTSQGLPQDRKRKSSNTDEHDVESAKRTPSFNEIT